MKIFRAMYFWAINSTTPDWSIEEKNIFDVDNRMVYFHERFEHNKAHKYEKKEGDNHIYFDSHEEAENWIKTKMQIQAENFKTKINALRQEYKLVA